MENQINPELLEALQGIHDELKRMNQTLAKMSVKSTEQPAAARPSAAPGRSYGSGAPRSYSSSAPRGGKASYSRTSRPAHDGEEGGSESMGSSFPKKRAGSTRSAAGPGRPKGKLPAKKGNGYPKKPR